MFEIFPLDEWEDMFAQTTDNINECAWQTLTLFVKHVWQMKVLSIQHADDMFNIFNQLDMEHKYCLGK